MNSALRQMQQKFLLRVKQYILFSFGVGGGGGYKNHFKFQSVVVKKSNVKKRLSLPLSCYTTFFHFAIMNKRFL